MINAMVISNFGDMNVEDYNKLTKRRKKKRKRIEIKRISFCFAQKRK